MTRVYIGVGSNIEAERNVPKALERLHAVMPLCGISPFFVTPPIGRPEQDDYYNGVVASETEMPPRELKFEVLRGVEAALGRVRGADKYAARTIDFDVLLCGQAVISEPGLVIPDPDLTARPFLAVALLALWPEAVLPDTGQPLRDHVDENAAATLKPAPGFAEALEERLGL